MDMGLAETPEESFKIFQSRVMDQYDAMVEDFGLTVMDGTTEIHDLQTETRKKVKQVIELDRFRYKGDRIPWSVRPP